MLAQRERLEWVRRAVDRLPEADRELLHLRYTAQLSFARIAETLDQPLGTVLARGHRALKKLKRILGEDEDPAG
jgi:RNA polymerase sigma-70 factor (ECF subfamily)